MRRASVHLSDVTKMDIRSSHVSSLNAYKLFNPFNSMGHGELHLRTKMYKLLLCAEKLLEKQNLVVLPLSEFLVDTAENLLWYTISMDFASIVSKRRDPNISKTCN